MNNSNNLQNIDPILGFDPWFLRPPKEAQEIKHTDYYIKHNEKKKGNRKVYQKVQYDEFEKQHIEILQQEMEKQQIQVPPDWKTSDYLKMCYCGRFDLKKDIKAAKEHIEWRNNQSVHSLDDKSRKLLENGMIYLLGRDNQFRPIVYLDCTKINLRRDGEETILKAICVFLDMVKKYMFLDYYIENWIMTIDTGCLGLTSLPINGLRLIIGSMSINFCATMDKMYMLNPSFGLRTSWNVIKGFIDPESVEKISFLKPSEYKEMQKKIPIKYIQKKYGGEHDDITQFWPPQNVYCSEEERHKILKNQQIKPKDKEGQGNGASPSKRQSKNFDQNKQNVPSQMTDSSRQREASAQKQSITNSKEININNVNSGGVQQNTTKNALTPIVNDGIKPKINIIIVKDDKIDSSYANAGFDEQLEQKLQEEAEKQKVIREQQKKEEKQDQSGSQMLSKIKSQINQINGVTPNLQGNGSTINNTNNNINITSTDYSEVTHQTSAVHTKNKTYNSGVPDIIDSKQEESTNNNQNKYQNDDETEPLELDNNRFQNNPIIQFDGEDAGSSSKCCQNCTIF